MQALFGTRTAADINLVAQLLLLAGLLAGFILARRKCFAQHANVQTAMVLLNLALILLFMVPSFYGYIIAGQSVSGRVAQLMIGHGVLGIIAEVVALYLILRMRTTLIPKQFRLGNIKFAMRATLALWAVLVLLGIGIYRALPPAPHCSSSDSLALISTFTLWSWRMRRPAAVRQRSRATPST